MPRNVVSRFLPSASRLMASCGFLAVLASLPFPARADCSLTNTSKVPLPEMGYVRYQGFAGGLYPNFANQPPPAHFSAGLDAASQIEPRDAAGSVNTNNGKIVLLSIGMSNTTQEYASKGTENFRALANADPSKNPRLLIVDGAQGGKAATDWTNMASATWTNVEQRLSNAGATTNQVQVIWIKQARRQPVSSGVFPAHAQALQGDLEIIVRNCRSFYPNLKIVYLSSRTRSYESNAGALNPEPFAYEGGFSVKWLIEKQIAGDAGLNFDPAKGTVVAPWLAWGPYLWADGTVGRSDGFVWLCSDLESDYTHPSASGGVPKVARQLLAFFKTDPTATPWFLRQTVVGQPPEVGVATIIGNSVAPLSVNFYTGASDPDGIIDDVQWTFDDGTSCFDHNPTKVFKSPGAYTARVTVTDNSGNAVTRSIKINVPAVVLTPPGLSDSKFQFSLISETNYEYIVQRSMDFTNWFSLRTNRGLSFFTETNAVGPAWFYRALVQP